MIRLKLARDDHAVLANFFYTGVQTKIANFWSRGQNSPRLSESPTSVQKKFKLRTVQSLGAVMLFHTHTHKQIFTRVGEFENLVLYSEKKTFWYINYQLSTQVACCKQRWYMHNVPMLPAALTPTRGGGAIHNNFISTKCWHYFAFTSFCNRYETSILKLPCARLAWRLTWRFTWLYVPLKNVGCRGPNSASKCSIKRRTSPSASVTAEIKCNRWSSVGRLLFLKKETWEYCQKRRIFKNMQ